MYCFGWWIIVIQPWPSSLYKFSTTRKVINTFDQMLLSENLHNVTLSSSWGFTTFTIPMEINQIAHSSKPNA